MNLIKNISSMKKTLSFGPVFVFCLLLTAYCLLFGPAPNAAEPKQVCFSDRCVNVEVVATQEARAKGLQERTSMPADQGMLFIFPDNGLYDFWMKDTLIPLDMIWINEHFKIVSIQEGVLPCAADPCPEYKAADVSRYVLEVNASYARIYGLKVGDEVVFK